MASWIEETLLLATDATPYANAKVASMLVYRNKVWGVGTNYNPKSHPLAFRFSKNPSAIYPHAELACIINAKRRGFEDFRRATLYVARVTKGGKMAMAMPCDGCLRAIEEYGIGEVVFTTNNSVIRAVFDGI